MGALLKKLLVVALVGLFLSTGVFAQQNATFKVSGPCAPCGSARVINIAKGLDGVTSATFDAASSSLTVGFNPVSASLVDIQMELSLHGYDAGNFKHDIHAKLPECAEGGMRGDQASEDIAEPGIDDIEGLEKDTDWENPDAFEIVGTSGDDDIDILNEEPENDDDLAGFGDLDSDGTSPIDDEDEEETED